MHIHVAVMAKHQATLTALGFVAPPRKRPAIERNSSKNDEHLPSSSDYQQIQFSEMNPPFDIGIVYKNADSLTAAQR